jgi:hypothetical protein
MRQTIHNPFHPIEPPDVSHEYDDDCPCEECEEIEGVGTEDDEEQP